MKTILAIIGSAAIVIFVIRYLRIVWFRASTLRVVKQDFLYDVDPDDLFINITDEIRCAAGNEYDAATAYMLAILERLSEPLNPIENAFLNEKMTLIHRVKHLSPLQNVLIKSFFESKQPVRRDL